MIQSVWKNLTGLPKAKSKSQLNTYGVNLSADLEPNINHQIPMTCTYGYSNFIHFKTVATEVEIHILSTLISLLPQFGSAFFSYKEGDVPVLLSI